jgi:hypothetical protein
MNEIKPLDFTPGQYIWRDEDYWEIWEFRRGKLYHIKNSDGRTPGEIGCTLESRVTYGWYRLTEELKGELV